MTTIDWNDHKACIELNRVLLQEYYQISFWTIPSGYLCPTITSRVNYLNWINDLLKVIVSFTIDFLKRPRLYQSKTIK